MTNVVARPLQESLLALLIYSQQYGGIAAKLVEAKYYDGDYGNIAERLINYWALYGKPPGAEVETLFTEIIGTPQETTYRQLFIDLMRSHEGLYGEGINAQFVFERVGLFKRKQELTNILLTSAEQVQSLGEAAVEQVDIALRAYLKQSIQQPNEVALTLFDHERILKSLEIRGGEFDTGIEVLDKAYIVPARGRLFVILGTSGLGKTWALIQMARRAMVRRKKVLFVTCELSAEEVGARFYQSLFGVTTRSPTIDVGQLVVDDNGKLSGFASESIRSEFLLTDPDLAQIEVETRLRNLKWVIENLRIRFYPGGKLTVDMLEAIIDLDAETTGFVPDMVIVDYIRLMKVDPQNLRISLGQVAIELRSLAGTKNFAMVTAQQISREGAKFQKTGGEVDIEHTAEDWSLIGTADVALTLSQTKAEAALGFMRLYVAKGRSEKGKFSLVMSQSHDIGQFCLQSYYLPNKYQSMLADYVKEKADLERNRDTVDDE